MQLSTRHRLTVQPDVYQRFRTFCYSKNIKMKETLDQILKGFLDAKRKWQVNLNQKETLTKGNS